jgi:hypothetical protein
MPRAEVDRLACPLTNYCCLKAMLELAGSDDESDDRSDTRSDKAGSDTRSDEAGRDSGGRAREVNRKKRARQLVRRLHSFLNITHRLTSSLYFTIRRLPSARGPRKSNL